MTLGKQNRAYQEAVTVFYVSRITRSIIFHLAKITDIILFFTERDCLTVVGGSSSSKTLTLHWDLDGTS